MTSTVVTFLEYAVIVFVFFTLAAFVLTLCAKDVIEHHHKIKGATAMAIAAQAQDGGGLNEAMTAWVQAKTANARQDGAKR